MTRKKNLAEPKQGRVLKNFFCFSPSKRQVKNYFRQIFWNFSIQTSGADLGNSRSKKETLRRVDKRLNHVFGILPMIENIKTRHIIIPSP
jgi:hypothetical protein